MPTGWSPSAKCDHHVRALRRFLAPRAYWINDIEARERALLKSPQLVAATTCGLAFPRRCSATIPRLRLFHCPAP
jgi:hypothetical protein